MKIFTTRAELTQYLSQLKVQGKSIGFVATMGALHKGHISLIGTARKENDLVVCSIFVNPTQFNDPKDLERYPRPVEKDIELLKSAKCDILFMPDVKEMYPGKEKWHIELGYLDTVLEAAHRPGHYQGVTQIVYKLFSVVRPHRAYFGQKDYQQVKVITAMVRKKRLKVAMIMCPIIRDTDGLAMSSRNVHLSESERKTALALSKALKTTAKNFKTHSLSDLGKQAKEFLNNVDGLELEYFEICNPDTLKPMRAKRGQAVALVAARVGKTRLIDNVLLSA